MIYLFWRIEKLHNPEYNPFNSKTLIKEVWENYELRACEKPYIGASEHLILWDTGRERVLEMQESIRRRSKEELINAYKKSGYTIVENAYENKSVPKWEHTHIMKPLQFKTLEELARWINRYANKNK